MPTIFFALLTFVGWGSGEVLGGLVARRIKGYSSSFWLYFFSFLISSLLLPFFWDELGSIGPSMWFFIIFLNLIGPIPVVAFYEGVRVGNASLVGTIASSFAAPTVILSVVFFHDRLSLGQTLSIMLIFSGLIMSSLDLKSLKMKILLADRGIRYGLVAMVFWGIYYALIRIPVREVGWFWPSYLALLGLPVLFVYMRVKKMELVKLPNLQTAALSFGNALLLTGATMSYNFAIMTESTAVIAPIAGSYPVLYVILSRFVFKEELTKQQILGILVTLAGIVTMAFF